MKPTDAHVLAVYEAYERERAAKGRFDPQWPIQSTADELGMTYTQVRDVVLARLARAGG